MINIIEGSYLLATVASLYINPVSCDGISQRGLARYFKQSMTKTVYHWEMACDFPMQRGYIYTFKDVVFFPVRERYKDTIADKALIETNLILLKDGFDTRFDGYIKNFKKGINMPALGCGDGGLDYEGWFKPLVFDMFDKESYVINLFV